MARLDVPLFPVKSPGLTVAFWLHPFDVGVLRTVLSHDWGGDGKFQINLTAGRLIGRFRADGGVYEVTLPGIVPHRWQHVVFTFTPGEKGVVEAHLDARHTVRAPATGRLSSSRHTLTIGGIQPGVPGLVDNLRLYNRPLTTAEVGAVYTAEGGSDWVELYNASEGAVDLAGLSVSTRRDFSDRTPLLGQAVSRGTVVVSVDFEGRGRMPRYLLNGEKVLQEILPEPQRGVGSVSYTHLTLPTNREV